MKVLIIEDNRRLAALLHQGLREEGWAVVAAYDGAAGLRAATDGEYDIIVLDWMLPELDGLTLLRRLRESGDRTPVLMLTARDGVGERVSGLNSGADDYLVKPFAFDELVARLRALVRRTQGAAANVLRVGDLEVDTAAKTVRRAGKRIELSAREYAVLEVLTQNRGRVVSREQLHGRLYAGDDDPSSNVIDVYVGLLRKKVDRDFDTKLIHTRRGLGYVLESPS